MRISQPVTQIPWSDPPSLQFPMIAAVYFAGLNVRELLGLGHKEEMISGFDERVRGSRMARIPSFY